MGFVYTETEVVERAYGLPFGCGYGLGLARSGPVRFFCTPQKLAGTEKTNHRGNYRAAFPAIGVY